MKENRQNSKIAKPPKADYSFICIYYGLLITVLISNILAYYPDPHALLIGVILPLGTCVLTLGISFACFFIPQFNISEDVIHLCFYLVTGLILIFEDSNIFKLLFDSKMHYSYMPSMFALMLLIQFGPKKLVKNRRIYLTTSFFLAVLSFLLNIFGSQPRGLSVFQLIILLISILFNSQRCESVRISFSKSIFLAYNENKKIDAPKTVLEEVLELIQNTTEKMMEYYNQCDSEVREKVNEGVSDLRQAFKKLITNKNIYEADIEVIGKDMDIEQKQFIEENFYSSEAVLSGKEGSRLIRMHSEVPYALDQITGILKQIGSEWNFDIFFVKDLTGNCPIKACGEYLVKKFAMTASLPLKMEAYSDFLVDLESLYNPNPYHNNSHAADVMCSFVYLVSGSDIINYMTTIETLACILACLAHDVGHKAKSNRFHVQTHDSLAIQYNDISVLEMMHASTVFTLLAKESLNFMKDVSGDMFIWFRKIIIEMILATDMAKYFDQIGYFKAKYMNEQVNIENSNDTRLDMFKILIKCADIGHSAKKIELHEKWCGLIMEEFFAQGDLEKNLKLTVSMFCDRVTTNISKSQSGFIKNIVLPLYNAFTLVLHSSKIEENCVRQLETNANYWEMKLNGKNQTEGFDSDRFLLVVPAPGYNPRRGSMPLLFA